LKLPDVICISETKLKENKHDLIDISGYNFLFNNSTTNAGGVGLYIKAELSKLKAELSKRESAVNDRKPASKDSMQWV